MLKKSDVFKDFWDIVSNFQVDATSFTSEGHQCKSWFYLIYIWIIVQQNMYMLVNDIPGIICLFHILT